MCNLLFSKDYLNLNCEDYNCESFQKTIVKSFLKTFLIICKSNLNASE